MSFRPKRLLVTVALAALLAAAPGLEIRTERAAPYAPLTAIIAIDAADAVVGRPLTPGSVAGVSRRTARRTVRRQAYIHSLPGGCPLRGAYYYCGGVYYQPVVQNGATVYIVVNP